MTIAEIIVAILVVIATICVIATMLLQLRAPDALTRVNLLGPLVVIAFPIMIVAKLIYSWSTTGFDLNDFIRAIIAVFGVWIIGSVASYIMGRSIYGVTVTDKRPAPPEYQVPGTV
ncbi:putative monovalent cation/H+ antiporter subunit G [Corynebacterium glaucum]|uniref:Putative monovalent cation/H+ antiporter subunit G n=1 Tax=Corynebacterium glaucum TaxID=187491 RepID=A0A1Q2HTH5_9CORY|nr:Na+/H+ antiporter subunit G [Corynebacterium glaucum]AQQ14145.1 putative monovalent cation/H+ antiporter subunit G [Corynebacterium glaucum]